ncbi:MAG: UDP-3-O-(3-hydroxymyristoyl) glucosamine N-acyltransferase [candidate division Zixibacteria bacterium SM23_73_2]|nr:MAG: UDP-3-O-(3-hydroxymyristoyl) glucosamine N-acyltransferase [candidate division Zixibacteria bacterium SM23_73_2]
MENFVHPEAKIGERTEVGRFSVIGEKAEVGKGCVIGNNVTIHPHTRIGDYVRIDDNTVVGKQPMKAVASATTKIEKLPPAKIGDNCIIGTSVVIYAGAAIGEKVLVADLATIRENVSIGDFTIIGRGVAVENYCKVGSRCKLETNVYICAYSEIEDFCFIAPCIATSNDNYMARTKERFKHFKGVTVKKGGRIGVHATILPGKVIGDDSLVAAGSVVTRDTPSKKICMGLPARVWKDVPEEQLLENQ